MALTCHLPWALGCLAALAVLLALPLTGFFPSLLQSMWTPRLGSLALCLLSVNREAPACKGTAGEARVWVLRPLLPSLPWRNSLGSGYFPL